VEFAEHKEYSLGDEIKHIDWKVLGRSDKYYVKQFDEDTDLRAYILLDSSGSMGYASGGVSKFEYGVLLAASLTYLMLKQLDSVGLTVFGGRAEAYIPPRSKSSHLHVIAEALENARPEGKADLVRSLNEFAEKLKRRSLIILISDLFDDLEASMRALKQLRHRKNEMIVFHLLDPFELDFPFEELTLFRSMEDSLQALSEPRATRREYLREMGAFTQSCRDHCLAENIDYQLLRTTTPLHEALPRYLAMRERLACPTSPSPLLSS